MHGAAVDACSRCVLALVCCLACTPTTRPPPGALLPAVLRQLGLLRLSPALAAALDAGEPLPQGSDERALRAGAVAAVDAVVAAAAAAGGAAAAGSDGGSSGGGGSFTARDLSCYLLLLVEEGEGRRPARLAGQELRPHCTTGTAAY